MKHFGIVCSFVTVSLFFPALLFSQNKKPLDHADVFRWRKIEQQRLSNDGIWVTWSQVPVADGDGSLHLWNSVDSTTLV
ncbi:MAG: hypothetical protein RIQ78_288, partial [Bacteroidota bacterium]